MRWNSINDALPPAEALIFADGQIYVAVLAEAGGTDPAFIDLHSSDLLPWPSHWMDLPPPPEF